VQVKGHARTGYQIERVARRTSPTLLRRRLPWLRLRQAYPPLLQGRIEQNNIAFDLGTRVSRHAPSLLRRSRTAGRGRAGRTWHSEKTSGIYMTVLLRPNLSPMLAPLITMVAGLAARDAVLEEIEIAPDLRWPNDLLLAGKKFGGILTEMHAEPDRVHFVIVGVGIDVNHTAMPAELAGTATIAAHGYGKNTFALHWSRGCCATWRPTTISSRAKGPRRL